MTYKEIYEGLQKEASMKKEATMKVARMIKKAKLEKKESFNIKDVIKHFQAFIKKPTKVPPVNTKTLVETGAVKPLKNIQIKQVSKGSDLSRLIEGLKNSGVVKTPQK